MRLPDSGNVSIGPNEYILRQVFGIHPVAYAVENHPVYLSLTAIDELFKGQAVSVSGLFHKICHLIARGFRARNVMR
jgi:hypothetical protein